MTLVPIPKLKTRVVSAFFRTASMISMSLPTNPSVMKQTTRTLAESWTPPREALIACIISVPPLPSRLRKNEMAAARFSGVLGIGC